MATLVKLQGGPKNSIDRLDFIIDQVRHRPCCDEVFKTYFDVTDELGKQVPFMYNYSSRPGKKSKRSRETIFQYFNTSTKGLPGNDGNYHSFPLPIPSYHLLNPSRSYDQTVAEWAASQSSTLRDCTLFQQCGISSSSLHSSRVCRSSTCCSIIPRRPSARRILHFMRYLSRCVTCCTLFSIVSRC